MWWQNFCTTSVTHTISLMVWITLLYQITVWRSVPSAVLHFAISASIGWVSSGRVRNSNLKLSSIKLFLKSEFMRIVLGVQSKTTETHLWFVTFFKFFDHFANLAGHFLCVVLFQENLNEAEERTKRSDCVSLRWMGKLPIDI